MGIGLLTKQLAQQAIADTLLPAEPDAKPPVPISVGAAIIAELQTMHKALKDDEELVVHSTAAGQTIRVLDVFLPAPGVVVLSGVDSDRNTARILAPLDTVQFVCKPRQIAAPAKPHRIRFVTPKPKPE